MLFVAIMAVYLMLLGFVLYGRWSTTKFAINFRKTLQFWTSNSNNVDQEERSDGKFSILYGRFQTPPVMPKAKLGRGMLRNNSTQKYFDNRYFTSLSIEKKDLPLKPQDEALSFTRERGELKSKLSSFKGASTPNLILDSLEDACYKRKEARQPSLEAYLAFMNFNTSYQVTGQLHQMGMCHSSECSQAAYSSFLQLNQKTQLSNKKVRLSRGLWNRSRRRNLATRVETRELSVIPERDESEERASMNVSSTRFKCQASDTRPLISSPALC